MKTVVRLFSICLIIAALFIGCKNNRKPAGIKDSSKSKELQKIKIEGDILSISPDNKNLLIQAQNNNGSVLWITDRENTFSNKVINLGDEDGVKSINWSPNSLYLALVVYNLEGHSPLTSAHIWVCGSMGRDVTEIKPLPPNERLSSFDPRWASGSILIFRAMTLTSAAGQKYSYNAETKKIQLIK